MAATLRGQRIARAIALGVMIGMTATGCVVLNPEPPSGEVTPPQSSTSAPPSSTTPAAVAKGAAPTTPSTPKTAAPVASPTAPPPTWPETAKDVQDGVARLQTTRCDADGQSSGSGTGFLVSDDLLVTAAHVVKNASTITAVVDGHLTGVQVLGSNNVADVALLRMTRPSKGHIFTFATEDPPIGTAVAALGFPHHQELSFSQGTVSGLNREFVREGARQSHLIQTDTPTNPGNSGGPMITIDGSVAGIIVSKFDDTESRSIEGLGFAVSATRAAAAVKEWEERAVPIALKPCTGDASAPVEFETSITSEHDQAENIAQTLQAHGQGINDGAYAAAFNLFTPQFQQSSGGLDAWSTGLATTVWVDLDVMDVAGHGNDVKAKVRMVSMQAVEDAPKAPGAPQTCSVWNIEYSMHWDGIQWLIAGNRRIGGPPVACEIGD